MQRISKDSLLKALENVRKTHCAYGVSKICDCKFGAENGVVPHTEKANGCPEVREAIGIISNMSLQELEDMQTRNERGVSQQTHKIKIGDGWYPCFPNRGSCEYEDYRIDTPIPELKYTKIIDELTGYIVDAAGIVWILELHITDKENKKGTVAFSRPCLSDCLEYVMDNDVDMKGKKPLEVMKTIGVESFKASIYDEIFETEEKSDD